MDPKKRFFLKKGPFFRTFETSSWIPTSNRFFWPAPIYRDINFVLKCLPTQCATNATSHLFTQMCLCVCSGKQFEKTFENSLWRKIVQMQPLRLCICSGRWFDIWKLTLDKNRINVTTTTVSFLVGNLRARLKTWSRKNCTNATNATMHLFWQAIWEDIWKLTLKKSHTNATNATMHL